ncbi:hypothetical protein SAMN05421809_2255 [Natronorubrum daqingense]|uniref:Uncharacterized protein n=1 Tax=Natronorubrum daqingense TaxID=588898 RepID=A0A1N7DUU1_9EURY|nr:hypothetical protein SAMN05421809_2255 [Natronorubrum daqingense]
MSGDDNRSKIAAKCRACEAVYSAWLLSDDSIHIIGRKDGCRCGSNAFEALSKPTL